MFRTCKQMFVIALGGLSLAACAANGNPQVATCYGIAPAAQEIDQCAVVVRQTPTRQAQLAPRPQVDRQIASNQIAVELRDACLSYGLDPGSTLYRNCLVREADVRRPADYASHFTQPGYRYDQNGNRVDGQGYLVDRNGTRIGGRGYWIKGPGDDIVPPGTFVDARGQAIQAPPPRRR